MPKKLVAITGATGTIGSHLLKALSQEFEIKVFSRTVHNIKINNALELKTYSYEDIEKELQNCYAIINLATKNNDTLGLKSEFSAANVQLTCKLAKAAIKCSVSKFIHISTTKTFRSNVRHNDYYTLTKKEAELKLHEIFSSQNTSTEFHLVHLPLVIAPNTKSKAKYIYKIPKFLQHIAIATLRDIVPLVSIDIVTRKITEIIRNNTKPENTIITNDVASIGLYRIFTILLNVSAILVVATVLIPLHIMVYLYIKFDSRGPALFIQRRVGLNQCTFECVKYRTMKVGVEQRGTHESNTNDITAVGKIIRKLKIDELPQALNILKMEMQLIGPRPNLVIQAKLIEERKKRNVYSIRPGITGLSQVSGVDMSTPKTLAIVDERYFFLRSITTDVAILWHTAVGKGNTDPAFSTSEKLRDL